MIHCVKETTNSCNGEPTSQRHEGRKLEKELVGLQDKMHKNILIYDLDFASEGRFFCLLHQAHLFNISLFNGKLYGCSGMIIFDRDFSRIRIVCVTVDRKFPQLFDRPSE